MIEVRVLEEREVGCNARQALGNRQQEHGEGDGAKSVGAAPHDADKDVTRWPIENETERKIGEHKCTEDRQHRVDDLLAAPQHLYTDRGRRPSNEPEK